MLVRRVRRKQGGSLQRNEWPRGQKGGRSAFDLQVIADGQTAAKKRFVELSEKVMEGLRRSKYKIETEAAQRVATGRLS